MPAKLPDNISDDITEGDEASIQQKPSVTGLLPKSQSNQRMKSSQEVEVAKLVNNSSLGVIEQYQESTEDYQEDFIVEPRQINLPIIADRVTPLQHNANKK